MNRDAIKNTVVERFNAKEKVWIVESPLLPICHGIDEDLDEAREIFEDILKEMYIAYMEGRSVGEYQRGRPSKGLVDLHVQVKPQARERIKKWAARKGISQGDFVHFLLAFWESRAEKSARTRRRTSDR